MAQIAQVRDAGREIRRLEAMFEMHVDPVLANREIEQGLVQPMA